MNEKMNSLFIVIIFAIGSCNSRTTERPVATNVNTNVTFLDSIERESDSSYVKTYPRKDLVKALYFISRKNNTLTQVLQDTAGKLRQVITEKNNRRSYFAEYYPNGQIVSKHSLDSFGQLHGFFEEYYETGIIKRSGQYSHDIQTGEWKNYSIDGNYISTDEYDKEGQLVVKSSE